MRTRHHVRPSSAQRAPASPSDGRLCLCSHPAGGASVGRCTKCRGSCSQCECGPSVAGPAGLAFAHPGPAAGGRPCDPARPEDAARSASGPPVRWHPTATTSAVALLVPGHAGGHPDRLPRQQPGRSGVPQKAQARRGTRPECDHGCGGGCSRGPACATAAIPDRFPSKCGAGRGDPSGPRRGTCRPGCQPIRRAVLACLVPGIWRPRASDVLPDRRGVPAWNTGPATRSGNDWPAIRNSF